LLVVIGQLAIGPWALAQWLVLQFSYPWLVLILSLVAY